MLEKIRELIQMDWDQKSFFKRIVVIHPESSPEYELIERAYSIAEAAFKNRKRDDGSPFFDHLQFSTLIYIEHLKQRDANMIAAILLHDIVEDIKNWSIDRLRRRFNKDIARWVDWVTELPVEDFESKEERNQTHVIRFQGAPREPIIVKACERLHNLMTIAGRSREHIEFKVGETKRWYIHLFKKEIILIHEYEAVMAILLAGKDPMKEDL